MSINPAKWGQCINIVINTGKMQYDDIYTEAFVDECKRLYDYLTSIEVKLKEEEADKVKKALERDKKNEVFRL